MSGISADQTSTASAPDAAPGLVPAGMLNEFAYCLRLCYLEWVQGEFADNADTVEGRVHHRKVDRSRQRQKAVKDEPVETPKVHERSVHLTSDRLGLTAKVRMVAALSEIINHDQDQVVFIGLGSTEGREVKEIEAIGRPMEVIGREPLVV